MKKEYEKPRIKIRNLNISDIIITSGGGNENNGPQDEHDENWTPFEPNEP